LGAFALGRVFVSGKAPRLLRSDSFSRGYGVDILGFVAVGAISQLAEASESWRAATASMFDMSVKTGCRPVKDRTSL